ncbi:MAG TPA: class I SAM-dependent methyltransferase [Halanaerobiales bacterium]|nr:class I SAM-dependent methyltransferase [Halanaerobiales bacterium]
MCSKWYEDLYEDYGKSYEEEAFVKGTKGEVDFLEKELDFNKDKNILDIGCGTGRHSIELNKRGYEVTAIDLSESMIEQAKNKMKKKDLDVNFRVKNALELDYKKEFDLSIILCEGAFSLMENDDKDYKILKNAYNALKDKGKLILTVPNAYKPIIEENENLDLTTLRENFILEIEDDNGKEKNIKAKQRYYLPSEISWRLKNIGFNEVDIYGCELGNFDRNRKVNKKDMEFLVIAKKE